MARRERLPEKVVFELRLNDVWGLHRLMSAMGQCHLCFLHVNTLLQMPYVRITSRCLGVAGERDSPGIIHSSHVQGVALALPALVGFVCRREGLVHCGTKGFRGRRFLHGD